MQEAGVKVSCWNVQDQSMAFGSDRSRFTDIHFTGKRYVCKAALKTSLMWYFLFLNVYGLHIFVCCIQVLDILGKRKRVVRACAKT